MTDEEPLPATALILIYLRRKKGISRQRLAKLLGHANDTLLGKYERGEKPLSTDHLAAMAARMGYSREAVEALLFIDGMVSPRHPEEPPSPLAITAEEWSEIDRTCLTAVGTGTDALRSEMVRVLKEKKKAAARQEAAELWPQLAAADRKEQHRLIETFPALRTVAMVERICETSARAAAHKVDQAMELAELALFIAERIPEDEGARARSYAWGFLGNCRRVANDFDGSDEAFARSRDLWDSGAGSESELLEEWRLFDLEASLRREQQRFEEALERLTEAKARSKGNDLATGRILLKKEFVLQQMEDLEGALKVLEEAEPLLEAVGDPKLLFALRFNRTDDLSRLRRYEQAAPLLPEVRRLAVESSDQLTLARVVWLDAKIRAGLGQTEEAMDLFEQVRDDFTSWELPYDAALVSLDLAELWLAAGRTAEVRTLSIAMRWIFKSKKIHREALASLALFCEAARNDAATLELTHQVIAEVEKVRLSASRD